MTRRYGQVRELVWAVYHYYVSQSVEDCQVWSDVTSARYVAYSIISLAYPGNCLISLKIYRSHGSVVRVFSTLYLGFRHLFPRLVDILL